MTFQVVSGVSRGMGVLDADGHRRRERGSFEGKCGALHCKQWGLCGVDVRNCVHRCGSGTVLCCG